ncbi:spore gernimation protein [Bacillus sp. FJAT-27225]|uniref:spore germination protein GerPE n=1 Tax=Bacillus sp. FJAT-27225 TaxID=1743144 RepID=UPI00080C2CC3|nr:spore germination protein GerPE [Bacillus sp. FJAT-27225]OCA84317.1 spore gernimation protein [Bacillus sp. FJAT-27225]
MLQRVSSVDTISVKSMLFSSVLQIGDTSRIQNFSRALAVQRERDQFFDNEGNFIQFPIFTREIPLRDIYEPVQMLSFNEKPLIKVGSITIKGISAASFLHIGNVGSVSLEGRIKHIRQLEDRPDRQGR